MTVANFGMAGMGVMGSNLALNVERNGFTVAVWDRDGSYLDKFAAGPGVGKHVVVARTPEEFINALERPRRIMIMVKAGAPVDWTIDQFKPYLAPDDIIIDGGNSEFADTMRRESELKAIGLRFVGSGVSGGEEGALNGPSLMPGGSKEAYESIRPIWEAIAAKTDDGACTTYIGPDGAGHFVKMVHNGIEYGDMQLIAEAYDILRTTAGLGAGQLADVFETWNQGILDSYLIEITAKIFRVKDKLTGTALVDLVLDKAGQKGTGKWTAQAALEYGIPIPTINAAIEARFLSAMKDERVAASSVLSGPAAVGPDGSTSELVDAVRDALYASKICSYAQGFNLMRAGSNAHNWNINLSEIARIWKGGCIIRARFLDGIKQAYLRDAGLKNLLLDSDFSVWMKQAQLNWRQVIARAQAHGVPCLAMSSSLAYYDSYRAASLPQNLTQAQRDFFGAHTYERVDQPGSGPVHSDWSS